MNTKVINATIFTVGAALGSVITWQLVKAKYARKAQEDIDSVKQTYSKRQNIINVVNVAPADVSVEDIHAQAVAQSKDIAVEQKYMTDYTSAFVPGSGNTTKTVSSICDEETGECYDENDNLVDDQPIYAEREGDQDEPYVIPPEDFGELGYETISLTYYADEILADERDELVEAVNMVVGLESLTHFGEYEDDSVFVRNDRVKCDYEILRDPRRWDDVVNPPKPKSRKGAPNKKPHQMED